MFWMIVTRIFCKTEILRDFLWTLEAGIFSANEDAHTVSNTVQNILPNPLLLLQMVKKQQILLFLKCFQIYPALSSTARV
jgi:hypothetical protein